MRCTGSSSNAPLCVSRHAATLQHVVQLQLARVLAVLLKRGWVSDGMEAHQGFFSELQDKANGAGSVAARRINVEILEVSWGRASAASRWI